MLGDINVGEPQALIGFAGPRVIEQTVRETLPEGFQRSEFLVDHGAVDLIVDRRQMRDKLAALLALMLGRGGALVPVLALFGLVRLVISGAVGLTIVYAILSWVNADSPMTDVIARLAAPLLRPFRRWIPLVGGFDLSPLALLVLMQVAAIIVANLQDALLR